MSSTETFTGRAIVCHDTLKNKGWKMEEVSLLNHPGFCPGTDISRCLPQR